MSKCLCVFFLCISINFVSAFGLLMMFYFIHIFQWAIIDRWFLWRMLWISKQKLIELNFNQNVKTKFLTVLTDSETDGSNATN